VAWLPCPGHAKKMDGVTAITRGPVKEKALAY
jgi:hypothetical protein